MDNDAEAAHWMAELRRGNQEAAARLTELFYPELRRLAARRMMGEQPGHSWQATALVNELYLELCKIRQLKEEAAGYAADERTAFLALAAHLMRRLLIHHVRPLSKRVERVPLDDESAFHASPEGAFDEIEICLSKLEAIDSKLRAVVEMKVYAGLSGVEIAKRLDCAPRSVDRYWSFARNWLGDYLAPEPKAS